MLVLTAVLVVAALIASVVSGCTEQVKAAENEVSAETSADTDIVAIKKPRQQMQIRTAVRMIRYRIAIKALTKAETKQIKRKLSMPRQIHPAKFMMCLWSSAEK